MIGHLVAMLVSATAFFGAILLYGAFSPRRLGGWKFWICFAAYCVLMEGAGPLANGLYSVCGVIGNNVGQTSVYKGYKQDKIEMRGDRAEMSDFPLYLNTVAGGLDRRDQTIGGFSFVVKIYAVPVVEIIG